MTTTELVTTDMKLIGRRAQAAARQLAVLSTAQKNAALQAIADTLRTETPAILRANAADVAKAEANGLSPALIDRLLLGGVQCPRCLEQFLELGVFRRHSHRGHPDRRGSRRIVDTCPPEENPADYQNGRAADKQKLATERPRGNNATAVRLGGPRIGHGQPNGNARKWFHTLAPPSSFGF